MQEYIFKTSDSSLSLVGSLLMNFCINTPESFSAEGAVQKEVKMFYFSKEGLPLFLKVSPQQLYEVFIKIQLTPISTHA